MTDPAETLPDQPRRAVAFVASQLAHLRDKMAFDEEGNIYLLTDGVPTTRLPYKRFALVANSTSRLDVRMHDNRAELDSQVAAIMDPFRQPFVDRGVAIIDFEEGTVTTHHTGGSPATMAFADELHQQMESAIGTLAFALRFEDSVRTGVIRADMVGYPVQLPDLDGVYLLPQEKFATKDIIGPAHNIVIHCKTAALIAADELLNHYAAEDKRASRPIDPAHSGVRAVVSHLRDAFAHQSDGPKWKAQRDRRRRGDAPVTAALANGVSITLDMRALGGEGVRPSHHGGIRGFMALLEHVAQYARERG